MIPELDDRGVSDASSPYSDDQEDVPRIGPIDDSDAHLARDKDSPDRSYRSPILDNLGRDLGPG